MALPIVRSPSEWHDGSRLKYGAPVDERLEFASQKAKRPAQKNSADKNKSFFVKKKHENRLRKDSGKEKEPEF